MYTPENIDHMTDSHKRAALTELGNTYFQTKNWNKELATLIDMTPRAVQKYRTETKPPKWLILLLDALIERRHFTQTYQSLEAAFKMATK